MGSEGPTRPLSVNFRWEGVNEVLAGWTRTAQNGFRFKRSNFFHN
jgi:hypothetical protein